MKPPPRGRGAADDEYRPLPRRRRLLVGLVGIATTVVLVLMLTERPGAQRIDPRTLQSDDARCQPGQTTGCVGGTVQVITLPAAGPAPAASAAPPTGR